MTEKEKVMRGLESHANPKTCETCAGEECPYYYMGGSFPELSCSSFLAADALAFLKEQEPRVMTLDEVYDLHRGDCMFVEIRDGIECNALMLYACENYYVDFRSADYKIIGKDTSLYQKQWRCWTSRPTEEQRKAVPWELPRG